MLAEAGRACRNPLDRSPAMGAPSIHPRSATVTAPRQPGYSGWYWRRAPRPDTGSRSSQAGLRGSDNIQHFGYPFSRFRGWPFREIGQPGVK